jgi:hypothetical protein
MLPDLPCSEPVHLEVERHRSGPPQSSTPVISPTRAPLYNLPALAVCYYLGTDAPFLHRPALTRCPADPPITLTKRLFSGRGAALAAHRGGRVSPGNLIGAERNGGRLSSIINYSIDLEESETLSKRGFNSIQAIHECHNAFDHHSSISQISSLQLDLCKA